MKDILTKSSMPEFGTSIRDSVSLRNHVIPFDLQHICMSQIVRYIIILQHTHMRTN